MSYFGINEIIHLIKKERMHTKRNDRYSITMRVRKRDQQLLTQLDKSIRK